MQLIPYEEKWRFGIRHREMPSTSVGRNADRCKEGMITSIESTETIAPRGYVFTFGYSGCARTVIANTSVLARYWAPRYKLQASWM